MDIPTKHIKLPYSGYTVRVYEYLGYSKILEYSKLDSIQALINAISDVVVGVRNVDEKIEKDKFIENMHPSDGLVIQAHVEKILKDLKV